MCHNINYIRDLVFLFTCFQQLLLCACAIYMFLVNNNMFWNRQRFEYQPCLTGTGYRDIFMIKLQRIGLSNLKSPHFQLGATKMGPDVNRHLWPTQLRSCAFWEKSNSNTSKQELIKWYTHLKPQDLLRSSFLHMDLKWLPMRRRVCACVCVCKLV